VRIPCCSTLSDVATTSALSSSSSRASTFDISEITGLFDFSVTKRYNNLLLTKCICSSPQSMINFCIQVGMLLKRYKCTYCKRDLKLAAKNRPANKTRHLSYTGVLTEGVVTSIQQTYFDKGIHCLCNMHMTFETVLCIIFCTDCST